MDMIDDATPDTGCVGNGVADRAARALIAYRAGFPILMGEAVREITPLLWCAVRSQGVSQESAQSVVQGVWVSFAGSIHSVREPQELLQWLLVASRRAAWASVQTSRHTTRTADARAGEDRDLVLTVTRASWPHREHGVQ